MEQNIKQFEQFLRQEERAAGTIEKYIRDVRQFVQWNGKQEITKEQVLEWKEYLKTRRYSFSSINSMLASLHCYFRFAQMEGCRVKYLRIQRKVFREENRELNKADYEKLISTARQLGKERLALVIETIGATGIRVSELQYLTVETIKERRAEISLKGKIRTILIPGKLAKKLQDYAKREKIRQGEVFITRNGTSLSRKQIWAEMKHLCKAAEVDSKKVFPHNLRHLFARVFYKVSNDIARLADVLGHSSIETTRIYLVTTGRECQRWLEGLQMIY